LPQALFTNDPPAKVSQEKYGKIGNKQHGKFLSYDE
jgi:hypothetical protein